MGSVVIDRMDGAAPAPLGGITAASLTPFDERFAIDLDRLERHLQGLLATGCAFVSPFGSTGEGPSIPVADKVAALEALARRGFDMKRLIPAAMSASIEDASETIATAARLECRAVLVMPPFYYPARPEGVSEWFDACATRLGGGLPLDVVLYHIPALSRVPFTPELIEALVVQFGARIAGIKDSTGMHENTLGLRSRFPSLSIMTGDDRVLPELVRAGGAGMIGGMPNLVAAGLVERMGGRFAPGESEADAARRSAARIELVDAHGGVAALKALLARQTGDAAWARTRPPLRPLDEAARRDLVARFADTGFDFPARSA